MSKWIKALALALVAALCISLCGFSGECSEIREQVLRLHVMANSDSEEDQQLKLKVRDTVVETAAGLFDTVTDKDGAIAQAEQMLPEIIAAAQQRVYDEGYDYEVKAELCHMYFTTREYETVTLPAGMYDALSDVLDEEQVEIVTEPQQYEVRFKVVEIFEEIAHQVRTWFSGDDTTAIE